MRATGRHLCLGLAAALLCACGDDAPAPKGPPRLYDPFPFVEIIAPESGELFAKYEITFRLMTAYENPFDPRRIDISALFTGPNGVSVAAPAFYFQDYTRGTEPATRDVLTPKGTPLWKARFAPHLTGTWSYRLVMTDSILGRIESATRTFAVAPSSRHGFVRRAPGESNYFVHDDGTPYFAVGVNMAWGDLSLYERGIKRLGEAGGNFARVWMRGVSNMDLEWDTGIGVYDQRAAFKVEKVIEAAEQAGIAVMLCFFDFGKFTLWLWPEYQLSPYRMSRGGPLPDEDPHALWTNEEGIAAMQRLFRYIIARYGYSTSIHSWEFWNEMDWVGKSEGDFAAHQDEAAAWHAQMAEFFHANDPYRHLLTTSFARALDYQANVFTALDFAQTHFYGPLRPATDMAAVALRSAAEVRSRFGKPMMIGELGLTWPAAPHELDAAQKSEALRRGAREMMWASLVADPSSTALPWAWDFIDEYDLYDVFTGLSTFVAGERLAELDATSHEAAASSPALAGTLLDATVVPGYWRFELPSPAGDFVLDEHGELWPDASALHKYLFSAATKRSPPLFHVSYAGAGSFAATVRSVCPGCAAHLVIAVDDTLVKDEAVADGAVVSTPVPSGSHTIEVDISGADWVDMESYVFSWPQPVLRARTLQSERRILGWVQNRLSSVRLERLGVEPPTVADGVLTLSDVADGAWTVQWWDASAGKILSTANASVDAGQLQVALPPFAFDVAFKAQRQ